MCSSWFDSFDTQTHRCSFTSTPSGWVDDTSGFKWLTSVIHPATVVKARMCWSMASADGDGSRLDQSFLHRCEKHKVLVSSSLSTDYSL